MSHIKLCGRAGAGACKGGAHWYMEVMELAGQGGDEVWITALILQVLRPWSSAVRGGDSLPRGGGKASRPG